MKQIKTRLSRHAYDDNDIDVYCSDEDASLDRSLRDSYAVPTSFNNETLSFLVHKWGVDKDIHKSNQMLGIILDNLLENEDDLRRLPNSLDIQHVNDPKFNPNLLSDDENALDFDETHFQTWLDEQSKRTEQGTFVKVKRPPNDPIENSKPAKKAKIMGASELKFEEALFELYNRVLGQDKPKNSIVDIQNFPLNVKSISTIGEIEDHIAEYFYWYQASRQNKQSQTFLSERTVINFRNSALSAIRNRLVAEEPDHCLLDVYKYF